MSTMNASFATNKIAVRHNMRADVNREFLTFYVPNGWDDVKNIVNRVLVFNRKDFVFSGWNSDKNEVYFFRTLNKYDVIDEDTICYDSAEIK